ncbi:glucan ABC transporter ATP-binding protein/ permease [Lichenibacterium dinghuense]|uniref:glucan ABC transporter ATP-binding protein/ permease n=1 Tax=Lichenibacterium dinghuense TaxID=2895977 RepID=UPI001F0033A0|nr:glucan ABC transporter ATP-binding protein/ permease [Lichenibacterium sp. 6Y81]
MIRLYFRVLGALGAERRVAAVLVLANAVLAAAQFGEPVLFGRIIDRVTGSGGGGWAGVLPPLIAWGALGLFNILCGVSLAFNADRLAHRRRLDLTASFFEHVLHLPTSFHGANHSGRLLKVMLEGVNGMAGLWLSFFRDNCASFVALTVMMPLSLFVNWRLGVLLVVLVAASGSATLLVLRHTEAMQTSVERHNSGLAERVADSFANVPVIQSFTRVANEARGLRRVTEAVLAAQMPVLSWWALAAVATRAASTLTLLSIFVLGLALHFRGLATVGEIVAFMSLAAGMIARLDQLVSFSNALFLQVPKLRDFFGVLDTVPAVADRPRARDPGRVAGRVAFEGVAYSYDGRRDAVSDVAFTVEAGETVALVGETGSGKSTTLGLLHRVFDPARGRITVDGTDLRDIQLAGLRRNIGVVFQEPMLFARSIEENLRVGAPEASAEEVESALRRARALDFVARQPAGLATVLGERGRSLSGGERQRLAIARVLLKDPPILLLDEATSALDAVTERLVQDAIDAAARGRTTFIIAHRLSTVRRADRILVFHDGRIVEEGGFDELLRRGGRFAALARAQGFAVAEAG